MAVFYLQLVSSPGGDLSELDRIQDLFPSDSLGLHGKDPSYPVSPARHRRVRVAVVPLSIMSLCRHCRSSCPQHGACALRWRRAAVGVPFRHGSTILRLYCGRLGSCATLMSDLVQYVFITVVVCAN